ncbi:hypothetical protein LJC36_00860 [Desulfovibrio sp. OttesenSCG-928-C14]|nr:hypothetical protein [Desulfovibrio sp. OttesenSCG-928-C14]
MEKTLHFFLALALILSLPCMALAAQAEGAGAQKALVAVQYVEDSSQMNLDAVVDGDIQDIVSHQYSGDLQDLKDFLIYPQQPLIIEICAVSGFADGQATPGEVTHTSKVIKAGEAYMLSHLVPEGMPNLLVCAKTDSKRLCWAPLFSGVDDSLILAPGFILYGGK